MPLTVHPIKRFLDKRKTVRLIAAAALTAGFLITSSTASHAQNNLLSNLDFAPTNSTGFGGTWVYQGFSTGTSSVLLTSVTVSLSPRKEIPVGLSLYADNAGAPGSEITSLGTNAIPDYPVMYVDSTFSSSTPISLAANTTYWVGVYSDDQAAWHYTDASAGSTSDVGAFFISSGGSNYRMGLQYQATAAAPEPSAGAFALLGIGSMTGATRIVRRRRSNDAASGSFQGSDRT